MIRGATALRSVVILGGVLLASWLGQGSRGVSLAGRADDSCARCAPVTTRAVTESRGFFIARDEVEAVKSAREFAYRVASERVVRKVEQTDLRCLEGTCVAGREEITAGIDDSSPCRRGTLQRTTKKRKLATKSQKLWRQACLESLDHASQCDEVEVQQAKPAWAECSVSVWAKKTRTCAPPHCRARAPR